MADHNKKSAEFGGTPYMEDSAAQNGGPSDATDIDGLPDEILIEIFSYLSLADLAWSSHTCRRWHNILKQKKSLWKWKDCTTCGMGNIQEVLAVAGAMPRLKTLHLTYSRDFRIDIAWPEATVYHHYGDAPLTWEPYFEAFDTECLVLDHSMNNNIFFYLSWVDCQSLSRIVVLEHPHYHSHSISLLCGLPGGSGNGSNTPRALGQKRPLSQSESSSSVTTSPRRHDKYPKTAFQNKLPDDNSEDENRICSSLEEVDVFSKYIWDQHLENLCSLGPLRVMHIECQRLHSLTFVRCCCTSLEVLIITDCRCLLEDAFAELCILKTLRILHLSNCRIEESTIRAYTETLPCLESFFFNGHEAH